MVVLRSGRRYNEPNYGRQILATLGTLAAGSALNRISDFVRSNPPRRMATSGTARGGVVTTVQKDFSRQYKRKKMPKKKKRTWRKAVKKFHYMMDMTLGTKTIIRNSTISSTQAAANPQGTLIAHLYGLAGTDQPFECGTDDLFDVATNDPVNTTGQIRFRSAVLDITMRNTSTTIGIEADVYEVVYRDYTNKLGWRAAQTDAEGSTGLIAAGTGLVLTQRGTTLFEFPQRIKELKEKILKKTKIFLPAGQTSTYQLRIAKNKICNKRNVTADATGFVKPGWTRSVVVVFKSVIGDPPEAQLTMGVTRKYSYVINEQSAVADNLL